MIDKILSIKFYRSSLQTCSNPFEPVGIVLTCAVSCRCTWMALKALDRFEKGLEYSIFLMGIFCFFNWNIFLFPIGIICVYSWNFFLIFYVELFLCFKIWGFFHKKIIHTRSWNGLPILFSKSVPA